MEGKLEIPLADYLELRDIKEKLLDNLDNEIVIAHDYFHKIGAQPLTFYTKDEAMVKAGKINNDLIVKFGLVEKGRRDLEDRIEQIKNLSIWGFIKWKWNLKNE